MGSDWSGCYTDCELSAAWIAVVASLGGVAVGGTLNLIGEQIRVRREERARAAIRSEAAEERWRQACVELASLASEVWSRAWTLVDYREADPEGWRTDAYVQGLQDALEAALTRLNEAYSELRILGMLSFYDEAGQLYEAAVNATSGAFAESPNSPEPGIGRLVNEFLAAVSAEFMLTRASGSPPAQPQPGKASE
jgi:hypothetical protein